MTVYLVHVPVTIKRSVLLYLKKKVFKLKQQGDGAGETSRTTNYELHGAGRATRAPGYR